MSDRSDLRSRAPEGELARSDRWRYEDTLHCNRCGFCTSACPTYLATGDETLSPRGRNQSLRAFYEGWLKDPADASRAFDTCLQCGACASVCFAEVPTAKLMGTARRKVAEVHGWPLFQRLVLRFLLPRPRLMEWVFRPLFLLRNLGVPRLMNRLGLLGLVSPALAAAEEIAGRLPIRFSARTPAPSDAQVVRFVSCGTHYLVPEAARSTAALLDRAGIRHGCARTVCCGLPALSLGDWDAARELARANISALEKYSQAVVLADDSSCAATMKDYPSLFEDDPAWLPRARAVAARVKDVSEWLADLPAPQSPGAPPVKATYHDPCKARFAQKLIAAPRKVMKSLPGVEFVELPEADQCCGGGGTACFRQPDLSRAVLDRKTACVVSTGAEVVVTSAGSCLLQLRFGLKRAKSTVKAVHLSDFIAKRCL